MGRLRKNYLWEEKVFTSSYYVSNPKDFKGQWNNLIFKNNNSIEIEVGTGKGIFIFTKAINNPNINYIAIDKYPTILCKLINKIEKHPSSINNLKIISVDAKELPEIFNEYEINKIYLNFVDPWPKKHHERFRLTNQDYLKIFIKLLSKDGSIEFKTDNLDFFNYTLFVCRTYNFSQKYATKDLYRSDYVVNNIATEYERKWMNKGFKINKLAITK